MDSEKRPRTIQIFLPTGDPSGIRIAEITTSIIRLIEVPRSELSDFLQMPEAKQVGVYFLIGRENKDEVYVGQSGDVGGRLVQHHKEEKKDWERALVLVSMTNNLTQTHVLYLESLSIEKAKVCNRYEVTNSNGGQKPHTPLPLKADCHEVYEIGSLLLATLGYPIFEKLVETSKNHKQDLFYCMRSGVKAKAYYTSEGMVVLKGSTAPFEVKRKTSSKQVEMRDQFIQKGILKREGNMVVFEKDYLFNSPSGASALLVLQASNGWVDWKTNKGQTLSDAQGRKLKAPEDSE